MSDPLASVDVTRSLLARVPLLVALAVLAGALGYLWSGQQPPRYTATAAVYLSSSTEFAGVGPREWVSDPSRFAVDQVEIALSRPLLEAAARQVGADPDALSVAVSGAAERSRDILAIEATAPSAQEAAAWATATAQAYRAFRDSRVAELTDELVSVTEDPQVLDSVERRAAAYGDGVALVESALLPLEADHPRPLRDAAIAALAGLTAGGLLVLVRDVRTSERRRRPLAA